MSLSFSCKRGVHGQVGGNRRLFLLLVASSFYSLFRSDTPQCSIVLFLIKKEQAIYMFHQREQLGKYSPST